MVVVVVVVVGGGWWWLVEKIGGWWWLLVVAGGCWWWLRWLRSLALVVEVLALAALTVDAGPVDAGCGCSELWFSSGVSAALREAVCFI